MRAIKDKVIVRCAPTEEQKGGIYLPEQSQRVNQLGTVVSAGEDVVDVAVGDEVSIPSHLGTQIVVDGVPHVVVEERRISYKVEK